VAWRGVAWRGNWQRQVELKRERVAGQAGVVARSSNARGWSGRRAPDDTRDERDGFEIRGERKTRSGGRTDTRMSYVSRIRRCARASRRTHTVAKKKNVY
jgi:hypothetical protein